MIAVSTVQCPVVVKNKKTDASNAFLPIANTLYPYFNRYSSIKNRCVNDTRQMCSLRYAICDMRYNNKTKCVNYYIYFIIWLLSFLRIAQITSSFSLLGNNWRKEKHTQLEAANLINICEIAAQLNGINLRHKYNIYNLC